MLPPAVAGVLLMVALTKSFYWLPTLLSPSRDALFRLENGKWQPLPELPGRVEKLRVSAGGAVWALFWRTGSGSELARLDGRSWRIYKPAELGTRGIDVSAGFVLDGEEVWAATDEGVLHGDGRHWKCYREAWGDSIPSSIVAADGKVWGIDDQGNLSHFDGRQWTKEKVALPGAKWSEDDDDSPELARTGDGSLWIVRSGVWRLDGSEWAAVKPAGEDFKDTWLVGSTSRAIWLSDGGTLESLGIDGTPEKFTPEQMGLSRRESVHEVAEAGDRTLAATSRGILEFDGARWRRLAPAPVGVRSLIQVRAAAGGKLFALGDIPNPLAQRLQFLMRVVPLALALGLLAIPVWTVRRYKRYQLKEHQRLQQAVAHATGAVPEEFARDERLLARQSSWWSATAAGGVIVGSLAAYSIARFFWPAVPRWTFLAIAVALHLAVTLGQSLVKRTPKPWDPIEPGGPRFDWGPTRRALPGSLMVFILMNVGAFPKWMGDPVLWLLYGFWGMTMYKLVEQKLVVSALRRGDYQSSLKLLRRFHFYNLESGPVLLRTGQMLLLAGRFREAEEALRRAVARLRSRAEQAHALESLGDALFEQGRDDEAMRSYEAALHAAAGFRRPYRGMAEMILRRGRGASRALEYIEKIVGPSGPSWNKWTINGRPNDDYWSLKAWALAELGRGAEVGPAVAEAIRHTNAKSAPDMAATYHRLGLAMQALDRQAEAEEYLKKARDVDPKGRRVALIKEALGERSVWRT